MIINFHSRVNYISILPLFIILYACAILLNADKAFNITLYCISKPSCGNVLIDKVDKFDCLAHINVNIPDMTSYTGRFYMPNKQAEYLCLYDFTKGCQFTPPCYCTEKNVFFWNLTADVSESETQIQAVLYNQNSHENITSNILTGPRIIKDPRNETLHLLVNGKHVKNKDIIDISNDDKEIQLNLLPQEAEQFLSLHIASEIKTFQSELTFRLKPDKITIKIKLCDEELKSYNFSLNYEVETIKGTHSANIIPSVEVIIYSVFGFVFIIFLIFRFRTKCKNIINASNRKIKDTIESLVKKDNEKSEKETQKSNKNLQNTQKEFVTEIQKPAEKSEKRY